jgi:hypothetical protein
MRARSSSRGLSSRAGRARRCGSARGQPRPAPSRPCPSPPGSAARAGARWQRRDGCASSRSGLSGELHQRGSRGMQLHANTKISHYARVIKLEGARVFDAIPVLSSAECERVLQTVHAPAVELDRARQRLREPGKVLMGWDFCSAERPAASCRLPGGSRASTGASWRCRFDEVRSGISDDFALRAVRLACRNNRLSISHRPCPISPDRAQVCRIVFTSPHRSRSSWRRRCRRHQDLCRSVGTRHF